jgi:hypothetical protein
MKTTLETAKCACRTPRTNRRRIIASGRHTPPACYTGRGQKMVLEVAEEIIPHTCLRYERVRSSSQEKMKGILTFIVLISTAYIPMPSSCNRSDTSTILRISAPKSLCSLHSAEQTASPPLSARIERQVSQTLRISCIPRATKPYPSRETCVLTLCCHRQL